MALNVKKINELPAGTNPSQQNLLAVYNTDTGLTEKITIEQALNFVDSSFRWNSEKVGGYDTGEIVTFGSPVKLYESLVDNNETTPQDDGVNWQIVNSTESSVEWASGVYSKASLRVFNEQLFLLPSTVTYPYNSTNDPETDGNWVNLTPLYPKGSTGSEIFFDKPRTYGTNLSPITANTLTDNDTGAKQPIQQIYHQAASLTVPASWVKLASSADYEAGSVNIIFVQRERSDRKIYSITKDA